MKNKKAVVIPFEWIFAMIVGAAILFLAIYGVSRLMAGGEAIQGKITAEKIKSYLDPFETGLATGEADEVLFRTESKIYFDECSYSDYSPWGFQSISFSEKLFNNRYSKKGESAIIKNKYVFADDVVTGKSMYIFSKPFFMGYKVADIIIIDTKNYCFYNIPNDLDDTLNLNINKINFSDDIESCNGIKVCFDINNPNCDITVFPECSINCESPYDYGRVVKKDLSGKKIEMEYINNLWIAAIFSSTDIYDCNIKRLMNKFNELGNIYLEKIKIIQMKGCSSNIDVNLNAAMKLTKTIDSKNIATIFEKVNGIRITNQAAETACQLFYN